MSARRRPHSGTVKIDVFRSAANDCTLYLFNDPQNPEAFIQATEDAVVEVTP